MKAIDLLFRRVSRLLNVHAENKSGSNKTERDTLLSNFGAVVLNGLFFPTAGKILGAGLLLTWFLDGLGASAFVIGLLIPIQYGAALLAQPWIGQWMSGKPSRAVYYRRQALLRGILWCALALAVWLMREKNPAWLLAIFFAVILCDAIAAGVGNIAFSDTLARTIPKTLRGRARGWRGVCGAVVAGTGGILIALFVSPESGFAIFAVLFAFAGICYVVGGLIFGAIQEKRESQPTEKHSRQSESLFARMREMIYAPAYRRFLLVQMLLVPVTQGLVFFSIFGRREFHLDMKALGLLILTDAVAPLAGNAFWGKLADRRGNGLVLCAAGFLSVAAPVIAIFLYFAGGDLSKGIILALFAFVVFALGIASVGVDLASKNFVLELAPDSKRPVYIGVNDTLIALPTMLLAGGGLVIEWMGFLPVFIAVTICAIVASTLSITFARN